MADDFRISELVTLAPGFARTALRAAALGLDTSSLFLALFGLSGILGSCNPENSVIYARYKAHT